MLFLHWRNGRNFSSLTGLAGGLPLQLASFHLQKVPAFHSLKPALHFGMF